MIKKPLCSADSGILSSLWLPLPLHQKQHQSNQNGNVRHEWGPSPPARNSADFFSMLGKKPPPSRHKMEASTTKLRALSRKATTTKHKTFCTRVYKRARLDKYTGIGVECVRIGVGFDRVSKRGAAGPSPENCIPQEMESINSREMLKGFISERREWHKPRRKHTKSLKQH